MSRPYLVIPVEWLLTYLVQSEPTGRIRRRRDGFHAKLGDEQLGVYPDGDAAAIAVWEQFVEASEARRAHASVTHGSRQRH